MALSHTDAQLVADSITNPKVVCFSLIFTQTKRLVLYVSREVATKERIKQHVLCRKLQFLVCGDVECVNPPKFNIQAVFFWSFFWVGGGGGLCPLDHRQIQAHYPLLLSNHTPDARCARIVVKMPISQTKPFLNLFWTITDNK